MLVAALRRLGVSAAESLYVGDMTVDIETARAAGVKVWVVPTGVGAGTVTVPPAPDVPIWYVILLLSSAVEVDVSST